MQNSIVKRVAIIFSVALLFSACEYAYIEPLEMPEEISFATDLAPIFTDDCTSCHKPTGSWDPDFSEATLYETVIDYVDIDNPALSELYVIITDGSHNDGRPGVDKLKLYLLQWIEDGALDN